MAIDRLQQGQQHRNALDLGQPRCTPHGDTDGQFVQQQGHQIVRGDARTGFTCRESLLQTPGILRAFRAELVLRRLTPGRERNGDILHRGTEGVPQKRLHQRPFRQRDGGRGSL